MQTTAELRRYCHYVAGTVGTLITNLLSTQSVSDARQTKLRTNAEHFGQLLQLVNIAKDVYDDYVTENNVYLPGEWLADEGITHDQVIDLNYRVEAISVLRRLLDHAEQHLDAAQEYIEEMPLGDGNTVIAWAVPYLLAVGTLRELRADPRAAFTAAEVKVSREEVQAIIDTVSATGRQQIGLLREQIADRPLEERPQKLPN